MNKQKPYIFKRVIAYFIDMLIISLISSILTYFVPNNKYESASSNLLEVIEQFRNEEIDTEEYNELSDTAIYEMNKSSVDITLITCAIAIGYYVIFAYCQNGVTVGKRIMKLRIVSNNNKKLHINNYLIRTVIINSTLIDIFSCFFIMVLDKNTYLTVYNYMSNIYSIVLLVCLGFMFYRNDGRGLHDILAGTKVINDNKQSVEEALVVKEEESTEITSNTIELNIKEEEKEINPKDRKKKSKVNESPEGVSESERI